MVHRIQQLQPHFPLQAPKQAKEKLKTNFGDVLEKLQKPTVSKHASQRLKERNIQINEQQWQNISEKMTEAKQKGVTDSLVVMDHAALLVSTKNHTVVTAMDRAEATSRVFTNINGTIVIND